MFLIIRQAYSIDLHCHTSRETLHQRFHFFEDLRRRRGNQVPLTWWWWWFASGWWNPTSTKFMEPAFAPHAIFVRKGPDAAMPSQNRSSRSIIKVAEMLTSIISREDNLSTIWSLSDFLGMTRRDGSYLCGRHPWVHNACYLKSLSHRRETNVLANAVEMTTSG